MEFVNYRDPKWQYAVYICNELAFLSSMQEIETAMIPQDPSKCLFLLIESCHEIYAIPTTAAIDFVHKVKADSTVRWYIGDAEFALA